MKILPQPECHSNGLKTNRDVWNYDSSHQGLKSNVARMIDFDNSQVDRFTMPLTRLCPEASRHVQAVRRSS